MISRSYLTILITNDNLLKTFKNEPTNNPSISVRRGLITIDRGQVPLIHIRSSNPISELVVAINFLRAGSPKAQFLFDLHNCKEQEAREIFKNIVDPYMTKICTETESFTFVKKYPVFEIMYSKSPN
jgi:hypothetical protein